MKMSQFVGLRERIFNKIKKYFPRNRFVRNTSILAGGTLIGQAIAIVCSPILTRLYTPNDFGVLAVYASLLAVLLNFASLRYEYAIPLPEDKRTAINILALCIILVCLTCLLLTIGSYSFYSELSRIERIRSLGTYIWLLPVGFMLAGFYNAFSYWSIRERYFSTLARTRLTQGLSNVSTQLGLGIFRVGPLGLLFGQIVGESAGMVTLAKQFWSQNKYNLKAVTYTSIRDVARKYKDFPIYQSTGSFLNSAGLQIPSLLFATYYGIEVAGWFYLTQKVLAAPITLIGSSVAKVFWGEAARLTGQPRELQKLFRKVNVNLFMIGIVPTMILFIGGQWIFTFVFGHKWLQSGVFVQVMAFVFLLKFTTDSSINFAIIEKHRSTVSWALLRLISVVLGIMTAVWCGLQAFWAVLFFSIAMILSYTIRYFMWTYSVHELIVNQDRIQTAISSDQ